MEPPRLFFFYLFLGKTLSNRAKQLKGAPTVPDTLNIPKGIIKIMMAQSLRKSRTGGLLNNIYGQPSNHKQPKYWLNQLYFSHGPKTFSLLLPYTVIIQQLSKDFSKFKTVHSSESCSKGVKEGAPFPHNQNNLEHRYRVSFLKFPMFQDMYKVLVGI